MVDLPVNVPKLIFNTSSIFIRFDKVYGQIIGHLGAGKW